MDERPAHRRSAAAGLDPIGGQAVLDGVLMRGSRSWAVAVRDTAGDIHLEVHPLPGWSDRVAHLPVVRGVVTLVESMQIGFRALAWSAAVRAGDARPSQPARLTPSAAIGLVVAVALFLVAPAATARGLTGEDGGALFHLLEQAVNVALLVGYIAAIGCIPDVRRLFAYHGAEHKAVNAYETGRPLTAALASVASTRHPRCGTSFLLVLGIVAGMVHMVLPGSGLADLVAGRLLAVPVVVGLSFEALRGLARAGTRLRWLVAPGMALQGLTTREPDTAQLEVAIVALRAALTGEELEALDARREPALTSA